MCVASQIVVSKLERMELSAIQIDQIWIDPSVDQSCPFQKLIHLDVNGCWNLESLWSFSMAKCLENLQSLSVSECEKIGHIFPQVQGSDTKMKVRNLVTLDLFLCFFAGLYNDIFLYNLFKFFLSIIILLIPKF